MTCFRHLLGLAVAACLAGRAAATQQGEPGYDVVIRDGMTKTHANRECVQRAEGGTVGDPAGNVISVSASD